MFRLYLDNTSFVDYLSLSQDFDPMDLTQDIIWRNDKIKFYGKEYEQPRQVAWMADPGVTYSYSKITMEPILWTENILKIKKEVERITRENFNSVLINFYRDGNDHMSWHCDNEKELGNQPIIASVSYGAERDFCFKSKNEKTLKYKFNLKHGSLLVMRGETQKNWYHSLPKRTKIKDIRLNLTFRRIFHGPKAN